MAEIVRMPKLSDTMTDGVVASWRKKEGEKVSSGDVLAEIETDKATMEFESFQDGYLLYQGVKEGQAAPVNSILAILGEKGEDISKILEEEKSKKKEEKPAVEEVNKQEEKEETESKEPPKVDKSEKAEHSYSSDEGRLKASPLAKKLASEKGIDISEVKGSGDGGRIVRKDIENYKPLASYPNVSGKESFREENVSQMRKTIARRLAESKFSAPHFYLTMEIDMDKAVEARNMINDAIAPQKVSFNDLVIKAVSVALRKHPKVNSSWLGDKIRFNEHIHIGVAIAVEEGLLVPVVRFADTKPIAAIAEDVKGFSKKAKEKKLQPQDWEGNTFTISNLGMYGIEEFTAIINPPDACIMAVGSIKQVPVVKNGNIVIGNIMKVTLSCDHRVVDGATGSEFLLTFKKYLENPVLMLAV
jgi:pyruvate dehydrogenase E2 component (dihydrolipoamide acetyltransferase)